MNDDARWAAVESRDETIRPRFVYAVSSTGVYCRAGCPSRTPRRERVTFFEEPAGARAAGFRACRRCRPDENDRDAARVARVRAACTLVHAAPHLAVGKVAAQLDVATHVLQRDFRALLGMSPREYRAACRLNHFQREGNGEGDLLGAILEAGYSSSARLYELNGALGMSPGAYRAGGRGASIHYATGHSALGPIAVAATRRGICAVRFGESDRALVSELCADFATAGRVEETPELAPWVELVAAYVSGVTRLVELPLDVSGTAFQLRVWAAIRSIPRGETRTYGELAAELGISGGARAVGRACATNELAIAVPCHRVVPAIGDTGEYRWGGERKRALLATERR